MRSLRKFPKEVKALPICHVLDERMREFKDSIPLFSDLKNDALRERWVIVQCSTVSSTHPIKSCTLNIVVCIYIQSLAEVDGSD